MAPFTRWEHADDVVQRTVAVDVDELPEIARHRRAARGPHFFPGQRFHCRPGWREQLGQAAHHGMHRILPFKATSPWRCPPRFLACQGERRRRAGRESHRTPGAQSIRPGSTPPFVVHLLDRRFHSLWLQNRNPAIRGLRLALQNRLQLDGHVPERIHPLPQDLHGHLPADELVEAGVINRSQYGPCRVPLRKHPITCMVVPELRMPGQCGKQLCVVHRFRGEAELLDADPSDRPSRLRGPSDGVRRWIRGEQADPRGTGLAAHPQAPG